MRTLFALTLCAAPAPVLAQTVDHSMHHPAAPSAQEPTDEPRGTDQAPGSAVPPPVVHDSPAARYWDPAAMAAAAQAEMHPPAPVYSRLTFDLAEYQIRDGKDGYRWEAEAWLGDLNRFVVKSKGEGTLREEVDHAEFQALYAKALDPWWNLQLGLRQDISPRPVRTWATLGVEGRAPYQFEVQAAVFLSHNGELTGRIEGTHDLRITQRLILQPRAELSLSAQDIPQLGIGAGLDKAELGLRLRYEIAREFAPYIGIEQSWKAGGSADYARTKGEGTSATSLVAGIRFWF